MVESGFATLAVMVQCWEAVSKESEFNELSEIQASCQKSIKESFSDLLQCAWLSQPQEMVSLCAVISVILKIPICSICFAMPKELLIFLSISSS